MNSHSFTEVTIIIVTYHSAHCFKTLAPLLTHCPNIIISDNASHDGTIHTGQSLLPHAKILSHSKNLGFGAANNRALAQVETPYALLLNPDCELGLAALQSLLEQAKNYPEAGILAPQILDANQKLEVNYRWPSTLWGSKGPAAAAPVCVGFITGAVMLLRLERFQKTGFFDENFFLYYEDDDLCLRLFQAKIPMIICPEIQAIHRSRGSVKGRFILKSEYIRGYHHAQSKLLFIQKHQSLQESRYLRWKLLITTTLALPLRTLIFSPRLIARMVGRLSGLIFAKSRLPA